MFFIINDVKYKIERNVPIPEFNNRLGIWIKLLKKMKVGDSVRVRNQSEANALRFGARRKNMKVTTRNVTNQKGYVQEVRVWRIK